MDDYTYPDTGHEIMICPEPEKPDMPIVSEHLARKQRRNDLKIRIYRAIERGQVHERDLIERFSDRWNPEFSVDNVAKIVAEVYQEIQDGMVQFDATREINAYMSQLGYMLKELGATADALSLRPSEDGQVYVDPTKSSPKDQAAIFRTMLTVQDRRFKMFEYLGYIQSYKSMKNDRREEEAKILLVEATEHIRTEEDNDDEY